MKNPAIEAGFFISTLEFSTGNYRIFKRNWIRHEKTLTNHSRSLGC